MSGTHGAPTIVVLRPGPDPVPAGRVTVAGVLDAHEHGDRTEVWVQAPGMGPVRAVVGPRRKGRGGGRPWRADVDTSRTPPGPATLRVFASDLTWHATHEHDMHVLGARRGSLDLPKDGSTISGRYLRVAGWCLFASSLTCRVDVIVNGHAVGAARIYLPRLDLTGPIVDPCAPVAGFEAVLDLDSVTESDDLSVCVRVTSIDGDVWRSPTATARRSRDEAQDWDAGRAEALRERHRSALEHLRERGSRVMVVTHDLSLGGGQLWLSELLRQMAMHSELDCIVVAPRDGPLRPTLEALGMSVHIATPAPLDSLEGYEGRVHELNLLMRSYDVGVVLVNTLVPFAAVDAAHRSGIPSVWAIHESFHPTMFEYHAWGGATLDPYVRQRFLASLGLAKALVFEAARTAALFRDFSEPERRFVLDYGVDIDDIDRFKHDFPRTERRREAGIADDEIVLLGVGTFEPRKAQAMITAAFEELCAVHPKLRLALVGALPNTYSTAAAQLVARMRHGDKVMLIPVTPDIHDWYAMADVFVCASDIESLPRSIIEAMAFELPVVSTDVFGIAELIEDGVTGWLCEALDLTAFLAVMHTALGSGPGRLSAVARASHAEAVRRHSGSEYGEILALTLADLLRDPNADVTRHLSVAREHEAHHA